MHSRSQRLKNPFFAPRIIAGFHIENKMPYRLSDLSGVPTLGPFGVMFGLEPSFGYRGPQAGILHKILEPRESGPMRFPEHPDSRDGKRRDEQPAKG